MSRPAAGGGRWVEVPPERLARWIDGFAARHGEVESEASATSVVLRAADGAVATCDVPFPPLVAPDDLVTHAGRDHRVGVLLVRRGGYAAGVFDGTALVESKVGSRLVQGRTAAGGQSQQRFARRREGQAAAAMGAAADTAARVLVPHAASLDAVVTGGDRRSVADVLSDVRLAPLRHLVVDRVLDVADPRLAVLQSTPPLFRAVRIRVVDPAE